MTVEKESLNLIEERKAELKRILPEIFVDGEIAINKLCEALGKYIDTGGERYSFNWAGRTQSLRIRDSRSKATLTPCKKESIDFDNTKNIFIEGENLEVLKILQKAYQGKVKMIYIDPPYNTGKDFVYRDDFSDSLKSYLRYTGQINGNGEKVSTNTETNGRYHSNWISMMYPRLFLARNLLSEDGVIFVSIDDNEVHNLRMITNEIFGEENFIASIIWEKKFSPQNDAKWLSDNHDYVLLYAKNKEIWRPILLSRTEQANDRYENPDHDTRGVWASGDLSVKTYNKKYDYPIQTLGGRIVNPPKGTCWRISKERFKELVADKRIWFGKQGNNVPRIKRFLSEVKEGMVPLTIWKYGSVGHNQEARQELKNLFEGNAPFDNPKPVRLIKMMLQIATDMDSIVLDFFAGSCTTAHAVLTQNAEDGGNRKFILVQLPEPTPKDSEAHKLGYKTIADICKERIRRSIKKTKEETHNKEIDLGFKVFKLSKSNCFVWDENAISDKESLSRHIKDSAKGTSSTDKEALLFELMLREGFKLDSELQQIAHSRNKFYKVSDEDLWMCFDKNIDEEAIKKLSLSKDDKLIVLDSALTDTQKVNLTRKSRIETV